MVTACHRMLRHYPPRDGTRQYERTIFAQLRRYLAARGSTTKHEVRWVRFPFTSANFVGLRIARSARWLLIRSTRLAYRCLLRGLAPLGRISRQVGDHTAVLEASHRGNPHSRPVGYRNPDRHVWPAVGLMCKLRISPAPVPRQGADDGWHRRLPRYACAPRSCDTR